MTPFIQRHEPTITSRIEFQLAPPRLLPSITSRIEFTSDRLTCPEREDGRTSSDNEDQDRDVAGDQRPRWSRVPDTPDQTPSLRRPNLRVANASSIPKPPGEPGRPGSGGFCVDTELVKSSNWTRAAVQKLTEAVRCEARKRLDITVSFRGQNKTAIQDICNEMMSEERWPVLRGYDDCWPVRSILKLTLKYGAEAFRRAHTRATNERLRAALRGRSPDP